MPGPGQLLTVPHCIDSRVTVSTVLHMQGDPADSGPLSGHTPPFFAWVHHKVLPPANLPPRSPARLCTHPSTHTQLDGPSRLVPRTPTTSLPKVLVAGSLFPARALLGAITDLRVLPGESWLCQPDVTCSPVAIFFLFSLRAVELGHCVGPWLRSAHLGPGATRRAW